MCFKLKHAKFKLSSAKETFSNWCCVEGLGKMCVFNGKLAIYWTW